MGKNQSKIFTILLITLMFNSILYYNLENNWEDNPANDSFKEIEDLSDIIDDVDDIDDEISGKIRKATYDGDYKSKAFFAYDTWTSSLDDDGPGYEWAEYDDIPGHDASATIFKRFCWGTDIGTNNWFESNYQYKLGVARYSPFYNSTMFSPVLDQNYTIKDKVHYLINIHRDFDSQPWYDLIDVTYKVTLWHFNSTDNSSSSITSLEYLIPDAGGGEYWQDFTLSANIAAPQIIPAGDRLKITYEVMVDNITNLGHTTVQIESGASITWDIVDGIYSNTYTLTGTYRTLGVQLYMKSNDFPDIDLSGATNDTVYQVAQNMTIDVTDGSNSSYRWDGSTWIPFSDIVDVTLPTTHEWHDLEIRASDPEYNNTRYEYYTFGYDASITNVELHGPPTNGSLINEGTLLNFTTYYIDSATYEWDQNGTEFPFTDPFDIYAPLFEEDHNLTIKTTDYYITESVIYFFTFDSGSPTIQLENVLNDTSYAPEKVIDVEIYDPTGVLNVKYYWDSPPNNTWVPYSGDIYRTYLPISDGNHYLYVYASDSYNHQSFALFQFYTDSDVFLVELINLTNNSYYQGGEDVHLNVNKSNGTIFFVWDSGTIKDGSLDGSTLSLNGTNALPSNEGVHNLTIITFDITDVQQIIYFNFTVDIESPVIGGSILTYNNSRFENTEVFSFTISDNYISNGDLIVLISIDGKANQTLYVPFELALLYLEDGFHYFVLYVEDLAGNYDIVYIGFYVDTTDPSVNITILELVNYVGVDGIIPAGSEVEVVVTDEDPSIDSYYSWDNSAYILFTGGSFILPSIDNVAVLSVKAIDSLGHETTINKTLILDATNPQVDLLSYPDTGTKINGITNLEFETTDYNDNTIILVKYSWDIIPGLWNETIDDDFTIQILKTIYGDVVYGHGVIATLYVYAEDLVGNDQTYSFDFIVDLEAPVMDVLVWSELVSNYIPLNATNIVQGGIEILYNSSANDDLQDLQYYWNGDTELGEILTDTWNFSVPPNDGIYNLTVILRDNVVGNFPNIIMQNYTFVVDNIVVTFNQPDDFEHTTSTHRNITFLIYNDTVSFTFNITDAVNMTYIDGLQYSILKDSKLNIYAQIIKITNETFEIFIKATNVTNNGTTTLEFWFWKYTQNIQKIYIDLVVLKKEGSLNIPPESLHEVVYEENITIIVNLKNNIGEDENITLIWVNGTEIFDFVDLGDSFYKFNFSSYHFENLGKGNYSLLIRAESNFFYAINSTYSIEINPITVILIIEVSETSIIENTQLIITGQLTYVNGTPIPFEEVTIIIYITYKNETDGVFGLEVEDFDDIEYIYLTTDAQGQFTAAFQMREEIDNVMIEGIYEGSPLHDAIAFTSVDPVISVKPPGLETWILYIIIAGAIVLAFIVGFTLYKIVKPKPFEQLMEKITDEELALNFSIMSPGVVLSIFDQQKGPVPLVMDHSLEIGRYVGRMRIGVENFLLKIADQAYSSLGFEEHDMGRRVGSIILPGEKMVGWVHGIQLPQEVARGGFENLSLIVLADSEYGTLLLNYQDFLYDDVDELIKALKSKKELEQVKVMIEEIRKKSVVIMLTAQKLESKNGGKK